MEGKCPFCGRESVQDYGPPRFNCGTAFKGTTLKGKSIYSRSDSCYEAELDRLREVCDEAYRMAGQIGAAERILDNLSDAANGRPLRHETFLPVTDDDFSELATLKELLRKAVGMLENKLLWDKYWLGEYPERVLGPHGADSLDHENVKVQAFLTHPEVVKIMKEK